MNDSPQNEMKAMETDMKYLIITGGVVSGLGKGITASSIGLLLKRAGLRVTAIKIDPYLNIDAGTMSPYEHGEVYVLDDGGEVDLDLGNYERFLDVTLTRRHNITTGKVYQKVLETERVGGYLGKTVQMVPHVTNAVQDWIERVAHVAVDGSAEAPQVCVIELGGTVGDIESSIFLEAVRQFKFRCGAKAMCHVHVSLVPALGNVGELKSKPTQHSMVQLRSAGLIPDMVVLRCSRPVPRSIVNKVSVFSMVPVANIIGVPDVSNIYQVPRLLHRQNVTRLVFDCLGMDAALADRVDLSEFNKLAAQLTDDEMCAAGPDAPKEVNIGIVGKYTGLTDAYLSVTKALLSAALHSNLVLQIVWIESSNLEEPAAASEESQSQSPESSPSIEEVVETVHNISMFSSSPKHNRQQPGQQRAKGKGKGRGRGRRHEHLTAWRKLKSVDGILIPGGFGDRGVEGKMLAVQFAREHKVPFLGICLGMQMAVAEFCRHVLQLPSANSTEFDADTKSPCVIFMPEGDKLNMGGTMRLGARRCDLAKDSLASYLYGGKRSVHERHRHRYEVNPEMVPRIEQAGLRFTGRDEKGERMEICELALAQHPFFLGCQFHPEFKSRPLRPSPPFEGLIKASAGLLYAEQAFVAQFGKVHGPAPQKVARKLNFSSKRKSLSSSQQAEALLPSLQESE